MAPAGFVSWLWKVVFNLRTPPQNPATLIPGLELIRGLACLQVFVSHIFIVLMLHSKAKVNPSWWKLAVFDWSYQSVMVFFVLSGCVIALSHQRKQQDFSGFMRSRFRRLEPLYLVALVLTFGMECLSYPAPSYSVLAGHLLFLQGSSLAPVFATNAPLWSLSYEFLFYLIFAFTIGQHQKQTCVLWFILGLGASVLNLVGISAMGVAGYFQIIIAFSPVWLLGVFLVQRPSYSGATMAQRLMLVGMLPLATHAFSFLGASNSPLRSLFMGLLAVPLLFAAAQSYPLPTRSRPLIWGFILGLYAILVWSFVECTRGLHNHSAVLFALCSPWLFFSLAPLYRLIFRDQPLFTARFTSFSLMLGRMSYAIYIIHFPILLAFAATRLSPAIQIAADIAVVIPLAWFLTYHVEPQLVALFDRMWPANRKAEGNMSLPRPADARSSSGS